MNDAQQLKMVGLKSHSLQKRTLVQMIGQVLTLIYLLVGTVVLIYIPVMWGMGTKNEVGVFVSGTFFVDLLVPYLVGLVYLMLGCWIFILRRNQPASRAFTVFSTAGAILLASLLDYFTDQRLQYLWIFSFSIAGAALVSLAFHFPDELSTLTRRPWLNYLPYIFAIVIMAVSFLNPLKSPFSLIFIWLWICIFFSMGWIGYRAFQTASPMEREQLRMAFLGGMVSFIPLLIASLGLLLFGSLQSFTTLLLVPLVVFPAMVGYAILHYRVVNTDFILSRVVLYGLLMALVVIGYALLVTGMELIFAGLFPSGSVPPVAMGLMVFILALLFVPVRNWLEKFVDVLFFRGERAYQERVQSFGSEVSSTVEVDQIITLLREYINQALSPSRLHIYIYDPLTEQYGTMVDGTGRPSSDLHFSSTSPFVQYMTTHRSSLFLKTGERMPDELTLEKARISLLGVQLFVPLPGRQRLTGWMGLGIRGSGEAYTSRDVNFLESLNEQAALAIERAQVVSDMENRVREMNVLARIAQGINITLTLDDILELIYAQTTQIIRADDFHIQLFDRETGALMDIFCVEENDRLTQLENKPVEGNQSLEQEIIRQRRSLLTDDYNSECQQAGISSNRKGIYAWMGVPLNAGAETIGVLSLAKRDSVGTFTREQLNLLQAISDQVAGAITKARLLEETDRRARQLATLNEMTRQLSSTLEPESLLRSILQSAVDILECEAGSLLMVDEQTDELVFRVTSGPVAGDLVDQRLPAGSGVVGKAVNNRQPVIVNNVQNSGMWFSKTDQQTGFTTRALLAVPLQVKDHVIGVIEVINKKDGSYFLRDDEDLLTAFAAQAAVALENARLYTMTDQALAARVEELSIMQRIDRELNASLEASRAMRITLDWAMRQSQAAAGLVGIVNPDGLEAVAWQGYQDEENIFTNSQISLQKYDLQNIIEMGMPKTQVVGVDIEQGLLPAAHYQTVIPIRRESATMGLLLLELTGNDPLSEDQVNFLVRLSDHAAIAISNAQLYAAVQAANVAKSEFVSFVSHELKNPMTSIKGYSELLAKGAVGPINDAQANFLGTIRTNVERMATLVSDLADVSRIEAGRLKLDYKALILGDVVDEVIRSLQRQIDDKSQKVTLQLPADLPQVWADRTRVLQVITNLVSNAYKYTPEGGSILAAAEACDNQWDPQGARQVVHFWVQDSGIGIAEEDQYKIFQKFFRSEDAETRKAPGTGLGLNITKSLVEMQGGKIWFVSEFRKGTTFHFTVPVSE